MIAGLILLYLYVGTATWAGTDSFWPAALWPLTLSFGTLAKFANWVWCSTFTEPFHR